MYEQFSQGVRFREVKDGESVESRIFVFSSDKADRDGIVEYNRDQRAV